MSNGRRGSSRQDGSTTRAPTVTEQELKEIITSQNATEMNEVADRLGTWYTEGQEREKLSSSQIRNVLDKLQRMGKYDSNKLQLLRPVLAYVAGRHGGKVRHLQGVIEQAISKVTDEKTFENFKNFFEAIVAYHRFHGGK
jgi:CRISPR-associated protein Csm2